MISIRHEQPGDEAAIRRVNDAAFGQTDESRIVDAIRQAGHVVISLVAVAQSSVVGHILFTAISVESDGVPPHVMGLGPMAVSPSFQRQGVGSQLIEAGLRECARLGCDAVVVIGHPEFYPRFGFQRASIYGLRSTFDVPDDVFMATELRPGSLRPALIRYLPEFGG